MRTTNFLILFLFSLNALAQSDLDLYLETNSGYEYNVFNANVDQEIVREGIAKSTLQSAYFQSFRIASSWRIKSKHHYLKLSGILQKDFYPNLQVANLYRPSAKIKYTLKFNKNHYLSISGRYRSYQTERPEDDTEVLRPPRAYDKSQVNAKYTLKLFKGNNISLQGELMQHQYSTNELREFFYNAMESEISMSQLLYKGRSNSHTIRIKARYMVRNYFDAIFDLDTDEETIKERDWRYLRLSSEYTWKRKKKFKMSIGMNYDHRQDLLQDRYGYRQYQPYLKMGISSKKVDFEIKGSAARRQYATLKAQRDSEVPLIHNYLRASFSLTWKLSKRFQITGKASAIRRIRNLPDGATSFLSYDNIIASIGIRYNMF